MRKYELVVIYRPKLEDEKDKLLKELQDLLSKEDVTVSSSSWWGKKSMAYEIVKEKEGLYLFCELETENQNIGSFLDREMRNNTNSIRHLLVKKEE